MKKRSFFLLVLLSLCRKSCACEKSTSTKKLLTIQDFVEEVIKRNPDIPAVKARVREAKLAIIRVQTLDDPLVAFTTDNNPFSKQTILMPREFRFEIGQKFPFPGKLELKGKIQQQLAEFLKNEELTTVLDLMLQAKKLFFYYYFSKIALEINEETKSLVRRIIEAALALYKTGKGKQEDVLKGEVELEKLEEEYLVLKSEQATIKAFMNALRNVPQSTALSESDVDFHVGVIVDYDLLASMALKQRSELKGIKAKITGEHFRADLAKREYFPDFDVAFMMQRFKDPCSPKKELAWGISVGFNLPIWIPRKQEREFLEAQERITAAKNELLSFENKIKARITEIVEKLKAVEERIILYDEIVKKTTETLFANEFSYRVGKQSFLTVLDTRRELQNFLLNYEKSRIEKEVLLAELERELGISVEQLCQHVEIKYDCFQK